MEWTQIRGYDSKTNRRSSVLHAVDVERWFWNCHETLCGYAGFVIGRSEQTKGLKHCKLCEAAASERGIEVR